jgi:hypothetical protein
VRTRCLSFHSAYRCRHAGECCRANWDIEIEPQLVEAVMAGRVVPLRSTAAPFRQTAGSAIALPRTSTGDCGFHNRQRCSLQEAGAERMLPSACRHFPRVFLRDARGCLVTLSHFCPTAAQLLLDDAPVHVVDASPPLALDQPIEGLDARDALPPLVRPGMLSDPAGHAAWEGAVIRTLVNSRDAESALAKVESATEIVRQWSPARGHLAAAVVEAFRTSTPDEGSQALSDGFHIVKQLTGPHPLMEVPCSLERDWKRLRGEVSGVLRGPVARYLAASAFGNWIAYRGQGLRSTAAWLRACHDVLRVQLVRHSLSPGGRVHAAALIEAIRMADYIMVHTVDSLAFGRAAAPLER